MKVENDMTRNIVADVVRQEQVSVPTQVAANSVSVAPRRVDPEKGRAPDTRQDKTSPETLKKQVQHSIDEMNTQLDLANYDLRYSIDGTTKDLVVKVVDTKTDKVIRQIPAEEILRLRAHMKDMAGLILEKKA